MPTSRLINSTDVITFILESGVEGPAFNKANVANVIAVAAFAKANTVNINSIAAFSKANSAGVDAGAAFDKANTVGTITTAAFGQANIALSVGQSAFGQANISLSVGQSAFGQANIVFGVANSAVAAAAPAFDKANTVGTIATAAFAAANTANANTVFSGTISTAKANILSQTLTDAATVNWDTSLGQIATLTLGGNRTLAAPTNLKVGTYILHVWQDATGNRTLDLTNSIFKFPGGVKPTLTTAAARHDVLTFISDGTYLYGSFLPDVR